MDCTKSDCTNAADLVVAVAVVSRLETRGHGKLHRPRQTHREARRTAAADGLPARRRDASGTAARCRWPPPMPSMHYNVGASAEKLRRVSSETRTAASERGGGGEDDEQACLTATRAQRYWPRQVAISAAIVVSRPKR